MHEQLGAMKGHEARFFTSKSWVNDIEIARSTKTRSLERRKIGSNPSPQNDLKKVAPGPTDPVL